MRAGPGPEQSRISPSNLSGIGLVRTEPTENYKMNDDIAPRKMLQFSYHFVVVVVVAAFRAASGKTLFYLDSRIEQAKIPIQRRNQPSQQTSNEIMKMNYLPSPRRSQ